jgi:hypothetical protein
VLYGCLQINFIFHFAHGFHLKVYDRFSFFILAFDFFLIFIFLLAIICIPFQYHSLVHFAKKFDFDFQLVFKMSSNNYSIYLKKLGQEICKNINL